MPTAMKLLASGIAVALLICSMPVTAQFYSQRIEHLKVQPGSRGASASNRVEGYNLDNYIVQVAAGQRLSVRLLSDSSDVYFTVTAAGASAPLHISEFEGTQLETTLRANGAYVIRVFLRSLAAHRRQGADYTAQVNLSGKGVSPPARQAPVAPVAQGTDAEIFSDSVSSPDEAVTEMTGQAESSVNHPVALPEPIQDTGESQQTRPVAAAIDGPAFWIVAETGKEGYIDLRKGPSTEHDVVVLSRLQFGDRLRNLGCEESATELWCRVEPADGSGSQGWVAAKFLREAIIH